MNISGFFKWFLGSIPIESKRLMRTSINKFVDNMYDFHYYYIW